MKESKISWTDFSGGNLNFVTGCTPISTGCQNCYARAIYERFGRDHSIVTMHEDKLERLARQRFPKFSPKRGPLHRPMAFVVDTGDLFHEDLSEEVIIEALDVMRQRDDVTWQILTKRPERMYEIVNLGVTSTKGEWFLPANIWLGCTVENQDMADERIPLLLGTLAPVHWISVEPMLESIALSRIADGSWYDREGATRYNALTGQAWWGSTGEHGLGGGPRLDWVVCGGESGPNRRAFDVQWAVDLYEQCRDADVPFFGKQNSGLRPGEPLVLPNIGEVKEWPSGEGVSYWAKQRGQLQWI